MFFLQLLFTLPVYTARNYQSFFFLMLRGNFEKERHLGPDLGTLAQASGTFEMSCGIQNLCMGMIDLTWNFLGSPLS